jgi:hypothetical protein
LIFGLAFQALKAPQENWFFKVASGFHRTVPRKALIVAACMLGGISLQKGLLFNRAD